MWKIISKRYWINFYYAYIEIQGKLLLISLRAILGQIKDIKKGNIIQQDIIKIVANIPKFHNTSNNAKPFKLKISLLMNMLDRIVLIWIYTLYKFVNQYSFKILNINIEFFSGKK